MNYRPKYNKSPKLYNLKIGKVFLYEDYIITEFDEGVDVNFKNFNEISKIIEENFENRAFGFIANRVNSYSINLKDAKLFNEKFKNAIAYAIVAYSDLTKRIIEIENHFFKFNKQVFTTTDDAIAWVEEALAHQYADSYNK